MNLLLAPLGLALDVLREHTCLVACGMFLGAIALRSLFPRKSCGQCGNATTLEKTDWLSTIAFKGMVAVAKQAADHDGLAGHSGTEKKLVCASCGVDWNPNPTGAIGCLHVLVLYGGFAVGCLGLVGLVSSRL